MKRTPLEVRAAVVSRHRRGGMTQDALAAEFGLSKFTVGRILKQARDRATVGSEQPAKRPSL